MKTMPTLVLENIHILPTLGIKEPKGKSPTGPKYDVYRVSISSETKYIRRYTLYIYIYIYIYIYAY